MEKILSQLYNPDEFREKGHLLVDQLAEMLQKSLKKDIPVNIYHHPEDRYDEWQEIFNTGDIDIFYKRLISDSIHLHHPAYMGHQISPPAPLAALSGLLCDLINNGMGVYEMGGPSTALEKIVTEYICREVGFEAGDGFLTSGGTLANLTALLTARNKIQDLDIWKKGTGNARLAIMVSEQAHYCVDRAVRIMGLGDQGIIKIPVNKNYEADVSLLKEKFNQATSQGIQIFAIVGSACTTSTGSFDDLVAFANFAAEKKIWFHVDGAHGGAAIFSDKYRYLLEGLNLADSVIIDCHKMMMAPALATAVLYRDGHNSYATFYQKAQYLFEREEEEWYNLAKRTFECTKFMMSVKFATVLMLYGKKGIDAFVTTLFDITRELAGKIENRLAFELAHYPSANILCYRMIDREKTLEEVNLINKNIRKKVLEEGKYYIVQTNLRDTVYLRNTMMNPFTSSADLDDFLNYLESIYLAIKNRNY